MMTSNRLARLSRIARAGLIAKGIVYVILGIITFMAAFRIDGKSVGNADKDAVFSFLGESPGGRVLIAVVAAGLVCYAVWRFVQARGDAERKGTGKKGIAVRIRYFLSGLVYGSFAIQAVRILISNKNESGDSMQSAASELLTKPFGQVLVGIAALILFGIGAYQIYYGLSEKYRKHVDSVGKEQGRKVLSFAGKIGYVARGAVWLLIGWLFIKAAINGNSKEAGDTSKAFDLLSNESYGIYILAAIALGLICYVTFHFVRARYEEFNY